MRIYSNKHNIIKNLFTLVSLLIVFSACDKELSEIDEQKALRQLSAPEQELIRSTNDLSLDVIKAAYLLNSKENFMFSPVSVGMALGMIYNGVGEKEKYQIQSIMGLESLVEKEINKSYNELLNFIQLSDDHVNIAYANSLWFSYDVDIHEDFRTKVMAYYDAEITELNFGKPSALDYINSWGNMKTDGNFDKLIKIMPLARDEIFLINAFSLNTNWKNSNGIFKSSNAFYTHSGEKFDINTLNWNALNVKLSENENYSFIEFPFENDLFLLSVVQPDEYNSLDEFMYDFSASDLPHISNASLDYKANISMPEIDFNASHSLKSTLSTIGLNDLFLSTTDLSPSFIAGARQLSDGNHLSKIQLKNITGNPSVDSFTDLNLKAVSVNKPFLYFVRDKLTNTVLFAGYYAQPSN